MAPLQLLSARRRQRPISRETSMRMPGAHASWRAGKKAGLVAVLGASLLIAAFTDVNAQTAGLALTANNANPTVGQTVTVTVQVTNAPPFANWQQYLRFDNNRLQLIDQQAGSFATFVPDARSNSAINQSGEIRAGGFNLTNNAGGSGTLGTFTFRAFTDGVATVATEAKSASNQFGSTFTDAAGAPVGFNIDTASVSISSTIADQQAPSNTPIPTPTPTLAPGNQPGIFALRANNANPTVGQTVTVTVQVTNAPPFANWQQYLRFDNNRLQLIDQQAGSFATFVPDARSNSAINQSGEIRAGGFNLTNNAGGSGTLGTFTFRANASGGTTINTALRSAGNVFGNQLLAVDGQQVASQLDNNATSIRLTVSGTTQPTASPTSTVRPVPPPAPSEGVTSAVINVGQTTHTVQPGQSVDIPVSITVRGNGLSAIAARAFLHVTNIFPPRNIFNAQFF